MPKAINRAINERWIEFSLRNETRNDTFFVYHFLICIGPSPSIFNILHLMRPLSNFLVPDEVSKIEF